MGGLGPRTMLRIGTTIGLGLLACAAGESQTADEYQVKAAFLFNFARFVDWPPQTFKHPGDPMSICVLGANPFGHALDEAVSGKSIEGRKFVVRQVADIVQAGNCQILFITAREKKVLQNAALVGVLTVGESEGFTAGGGVIGFKLESGKVRLEINVDAAEQRKLRISSKLLSLAQIVKSSGI
jgi:hypothetical protein